MTHQMEDYSFYRRKFWKSSLFHKFQGRGDGDTPNGGLLILPQEILEKFTFPLTINFAKFPFLLHPDKETVEISEWSGESRRGWRREDVTPESTRPGVKCNSTKNSYSGRP